MKTIHKILFLSIFMLIASSNFELKSQVCPTGFTPKFKILNINGCDYEVEICYKCDVTGPYNSLRVVGITKLVPACVQTWSIDQITNYIWDYLLSKDFIDELFDECDNLIPPCDVPFTVDYYIERIEDICWYKKNVGGLIHYYPCYSGQVYCQTIWKICRLPNNEYRKDLYYGPSVSGNINTVCPSSTVPADPALNQQTDCFNIPTLCSPY